MRSEILLIRFVKMQAIWLLERQVRSQLGVSVKVLTVIKTTFLGIHRYADSAVSLRFII